MSSAAEVAPVAALPDAEVASDDQLARKPRPMAGS